MENSITVNEPKGIGFFSIKSGETHYAKLRATISAYINSSDMGINASRGQDYGWRLDPEWVKKVRAFRKDRTAMSILTSSNHGQKPTTTQILYYMYGQQLADYYEQLEDNENPFEEMYMAAINSGKPIREAAAEAGMPEALADFQALEEEDDLTDLIDEVIEEDEPEAPAQPEKPAEKPANKPADKPKDNKPKQK